MLCDCVKNYTGDGACPAVNALLCSIKLHPALGAEALRESQIGSEELITIVLRHHECEDGSGYPFKVYANEIPFEVKLVKVSDSFSAMIAERHYKPSYPKSYCVDEALRSGRFEARHQRVIKEILHAVDYGKGGRDERAHKKTRARTG